MRVIVNLTNAECELVEDLVSISPRKRAARLRMLATIGLFAYKNGLDSSGSKSPTIQTNEGSEPTHDDSDNNKRKALKSRLVSSLS